METLSLNHSTHQGYKFIKEQSTSTYSNASCLDWDDFVHRYDEKEDIFRIYFIKTVPSMIKDKDQLVDGVACARDEDKRILYLEFSKALETLGCHLWDYLLPVDGKKPLAMKSSYDNQEDALYLQFVEVSPVSTDHFKYQVMFDKDKEGKWIGVEILDASKLLCKRK